MARVSFKSDNTLQKFIHFIHQYGIDKYISLPGKTVYKSCLCRLKSKIMPFFFAESSMLGAVGSGKSFLLSALAQLQVNYKINTRCPLHFCMKKSNLKRAEVSIKWNARSQYKDEAAWPKVSLDDWEGAIAQVAAAQALLQKLSGCEVVSDMIEVNVYGPECVNLTLVDLPGIMGTVGKEETERLIAETKKLIESYLSDPRCAILAIQPAIADIFDYDAYEVDPVRCLVLYEVSR